MLYRCHRSFNIKLAVVVTVRSQVKLSCQCASLFPSGAQTFGRIYVLTAPDLCVMQCRRHRHWHASAWLCLQQQPWSSFTSQLSCAAAQRRTVGAIASSSTSRKRIASCCQLLLAYPSHTLLRWRCFSWELPVLSFMLNATSVVQVGAAGIVVHMPCSGVFLSCIACKLSQEDAGPCEVRSDVAHAPHVKDRRCLT